MKEKQVYVLCAELDHTRSEVYVRN